MKRVGGLRLKFFLGLIAILSGCGAAEEDQSAMASMVDVCIQHGGGVAACKAKYASGSGGSNYRFARNSENVAYRRGTVGRCYEGVAEAMDLTFGTSAATWSAYGIGAAHAYQFAEWANYNPRDLAAIFKLKRSGLSSYGAPVGSLFIYDRGVCGMSSVSGHIEVKVDSSYACSDHCRQYSCQPSDIYVPI